MQREVEAAFAEMLDISTDIDKAVIFGPGGVLASNMDQSAHDVVLNEAKELVKLGEANAERMGSQPLTQLVVEAGEGLVLIVREVGADGMTAVATAKRGSRVGLALYDLRTCLRDAREAMKAAASQGEGEEA
mgnify:CR=1 FL=1